jgi:RNA polymerase sigma-70 factor (ECF subfamily)
VTGPAASGAPDRRLVERAARGEAGAFGQLYQRHVGTVFNYILFRVRDSVLAEDLTHDVFVRAYLAMDDLRQHDRFVPWLMAIAHRRVLNHWREQSARPAADDRAWPAGPGAPADTPAADDLEALHTRLAAEHVLEATSHLTDLQQQVIALRFVAGLSVAETAEAMDRSQNAVKNLQHHALAALRRTLAAEEGLP